MNLTWLCTALVTLSLTIANSADASRVKPGLKWAQKQAHSALTSRSKHQNHIRVHQNKRYIDVTKPLRRGHSTIWLQIWQFKILGLSSGSPRLAPAHRMFLEYNNGTQIEYSTFGKRHSSKEFNATGKTSKRVTNIRINKSTELDNGLLLISSETFANSNFSAPSLKLSAIVGPNTKRANVTIKQKRTPNIKYRLNLRGIDIFNDRLALYKELLSSMWRLRASSVQTHYKTSQLLKR